MDNSYNYNVTGDARQHLVIEDEVRSYLLDTAKWGKFLSILGFIAGGLMIVASLGMMTLGGAIGSGWSNALGFLGGFGLGIIYLIGALIYFYPSYCLYKCSTSMKRAIRFNQQSDLNMSFLYLKKQFQFWGIIALILLLLYGVFFLVMIVGVFMFKPY